MLLLATHHSLQNTPFCIYIPIFIANHALPRPSYNMFGSTVTHLSVTLPFTNVNPSGFYLNHITHFPGSLPCFQIHGDSYTGNVFTSSMGMNCNQLSRSYSCLVNVKWPIYDVVQKGWWS